MGVGSDPAYDNMWNLWNSPRARPDMTISVEKDVKPTSKFIFLGERSNSLILEPTTRVSY